MTSREVRESEVAVCDHEAFGGIVCRAMEVHDPAHVSAEGQGRRHVLSWTCGPARGSGLPELPVEVGGDDSNLVRGPERPTTASRRQRDATLGELRVAFPLGLGLRLLPRGGLMLGDVGMSPDSRFTGLASANPSPLATWPHTPC